MNKFLAMLIASFFAMGAAQQASAQCNLTAEIQDSTFCNATAVQMQVNWRGGTSPFTYLWSTGATTQWVNNQPFNSTYSVTITDANGCMATDSRTYGQPSGSQLSVTHNIITPACNPGGTGATVEMVAAGGTQPYTYYWQNASGQTNAIANGLSGYIYGYVTDAAGCYAYVSTTLSGINYYGGYANDASCNTNNGSIQIQVQGNYTYLWSNGQTSMTATGLAAGPYEITITDAANNCSLRQVFQVGYNPNCESVISGVVDINQNCVNGATFGYNWYRTIRITNLSNNQVDYAYANQQGFYEFRTLDAATFSIEAVNNGYNNLTTICPNSGGYSVTTNTNGGTYPNNDFYLAYPNDNDVVLELFQSAARVGFNANTYAYVCNQGNNTQSGVLTVNIDPLLIYNSTNPYGWSFYQNTAVVSAPSVSGNTLTYNYTGLEAGECFYLHILSDVPQNAPMGQTIYCSASVTEASGADANPSNNVDSCSHITTNSYDPNDKQQFNYRRGDAFDAEIFSQDTELNYMIRFQNTGNAPAIRVEVRDVLEANLLVESMRNIVTSHSCVVRADGQNLSFIFDNIYLADSFSNEPASHGFIKFTINRAAGLPLQTEINNSADIYFDFNPAIVTNTQTTTIVAEVVAAEKVADQIDLQVMPNPVKDVLNVRYNLPQAGKVSMSLINSLGQTSSTVANAQAQTVGLQTAQVSMSELPAGVYYLYIQTENGNFAHKIVKE